MNPSGSDHIPVDKFTGSTFDSVSNDAIAYLSDPNPGWAIIKDCGNFPCTGPENAVYKFEQNTFTGSPTPTVTDPIFQVVPNNPEAVEDIANCTLVPGWNGYVCQNERIGQLVFESLDPDRMDRTFSPINYLGINRLTGEKTSFNNTMNSFMDH